jgi:hypothetical protein
MICPSCYIVVSYLNFNFSSLLESGSGSDLVHSGFVVVDSDPQLAHMSILVQ